MKDTELINLFWERSETAIAIAAETYGSYCYTISYQILSSREDAEECVNETWLSAWNVIPPKRPERLAAFFGKITRNLSINRYQQYSAEKRGGCETALALDELADCIPDRTDVEAVLDTKLLSDAISAFLYAQPKQKRNLFIRRYWYLVPVKVLAAQSGMKENSVASVLFRMRGELKEHLTKEGIAL